MKIVYLRKKPWDQHNKSLEVRSGRVFRFDLEMNVKADNNTVSRNDFVCSVCGPVCQDVDVLKREIILSKSIIQADYEARLRTKAIEL